MPLNLHVEQLTLAHLELSPGQRSRFQSALQHELARLISEQGIPPSLQQDGYLPSVSLDASNVRLKDAVQLGQHLARSLYRDLWHGSPLEPTPQDIGSPAGQPRIVSSHATPIDHAPNDTTTTLTTDPTGNPPASIRPSHNPQDMGRGI